MKPVFQTSAGQSLSPKPLTETIARFTLAVKSIANRVVRSEALSPPVDKNVPESQGGNVWDMDGESELRDENWRNPTDAEWRELYTRLNSGTVWSQEEWRAAWEYLKGQFNNNLIADVHESEETMRHPFFPDRYLMPQAQEIDRLAVNQAMYLYGVATLEEVGLVEPNPVPRSDESKTD